jgi:hypothetical protein
MNFDAFRAVSIHTEVSWDATPCNVACGWWQASLHLWSQPTIPYSATAQKTTVWKIRRYNHSRLWASMRHLCYVVSLS